MKRTALLFFLLIFQVVTGIAQQTKISGRVFDAATKEPLPFVSVGFKNSKTVTSTDIDGMYSISTDSPTDSLVYSYVGYIRLAKADGRGARRRRRE